ncbi:MAG: zinc ribbon domain-containing protein, partial [Methanomicrobiales archaeon]
MVDEILGDQTEYIGNDEAKKWKGKGDQFFYQDNYTTAIECYDVAIKIDLRYANAWNNRGSALLKLGRNDDAIASYDKALEINPGDSEVQHNRSVALRKIDGAVDIESKTTKKICPNCGTAHTPSKTFCRLCGTPLPSQPIAREQQSDASPFRMFTIRDSSQPIAEEQKSDATKKVCPKCGTVHTPSKTFCRLCGTPLSSQPVPGELNATKKTCPKCSTVQKPGAKFCSLCGFQFSGEVISNEDLPVRITSVEQKVSSLSRFKSPVQALIVKAREQYLAGAYSTVQTTLDTAENAIPTLARCETQLAQWNTQGYTTTTLESLKTDNINTITSVFQAFGQDLATLEQLGRRVEELKRSFGQGNTDPLVLQRIAGIAAQKKDPRNIPGIKREIEALEQVLRDQQERSRQQQNTGQLLTRLQAKAEKLARYAPLVTGSLKTAEDQNTAGKFGDARKTLQVVEGTIDTLLENEASLASWKKKGFDTAGLETLQPENIGEVITAFQQTDQAICRLETIAKELASKKGSAPHFFEQTGTAGLVLSIERNLHDPARIETVERDYQQLNNAICQLEEQQKRTEQQLREQAEKIEREAGSPAVKREIATITKCIRQQDIPRAMDLFKGLAEQQLALVNTTLATLRADGAVVSTSSESISKHIETQHYGDAVIGSEKAIAELSRVQELYAKAKILRPDATGPVIIALYNSGKYEEFIRASEEQQRLKRKITELKDKGRKLLDEAEKFGLVPEQVRSQLDATDIPTIQRAITELETFRTTIKPELVLNLGHTQLIADEWA